MLVEALGPPAGVAARVGGGGARRQGEAVVLPEAVDIGEARLAQPVELVSTGAVRSTRIRSTAVSHPSSVVPFAFASRSCQRS
jgi:hypothetical protein